MRIVFAKPASAGEGSATRAKSMKRALLLALAFGCGLAAIPTTRAQTPAVLNITPD
jgi:hypothetical protein